MKNGPTSTVIYLFNKHFFVAINQSQSQTVNSKLCRKTVLTFQNEDIFRQQTGTHSQADSQMLCIKSFIKLAYHLQ